MPRPDRCRHLRIEAEPASWVVEMALAGRSSGASGDAIRQRVRAMRDAARELESCVNKVGGELRVETASVAVMYTELAGFVACHGRVDLHAVRDDRGPAWWHVVDVLRALDRLQGYHVRITLGGRACTTAEAIAAVAPHGAASRGPSAAEVEAYRRRVRLERQAREPREPPRPRGTQPPYGPSARPAGPTRGPSPSSPRPPPPAPAPPRPVGPAEFFLARTGLRRPFDLIALKKAFRRGVKAVHPDQRPGDRHAHEEFCRFKKGYDELVAEVSRRKPATS